MTFLANETSEQAFVAFQRFSRFFADLFSQPGLLNGASCRESYKNDVPKYYGRIFSPGIDTVSSRHLKWYRRLAPVFSLPFGSKIVDFGGGYGMDAIFLASLGYEVLFCEITPNHIAIAQWFSDRFSQDIMPLKIKFVLFGKDPDPLDVDAVLLNEVAHHIEPQQHTFDRAAAMLRSGGQLFLLEPNFWCPLVQAYFFKIRGFKTVVSSVNEETGERYELGNEHIRSIRAWNRMARKAGFAHKSTDFIIPWFYQNTMPWPSRLRTTAERVPVLRDLLASHVTQCYLKQ